MKTEEVMDRFDEYVDKMAESLGVAGEYVMEALVTQQVIEGVISMGVLILSVLLAIALFIAGNKVKDTDGTYALYLGTALVSVSILLYFVAGGFSTHLSQIINPEYHAVKEILDVFKGGNN